jgi:hypothetical protein
VYPESCWQSPGWQRANARQIATARLAADE